jgi:hypothetical protein
MLARDFGKAGDLIDQFCMVKANLAPSGSPWNIDDSGKRISVAANDPPKMMITAS